MLSALLRDNAISSKPSSKHFFLNGSNSNLKDLFPYRISCSVNLTSIFSFLEEYSDNSFIDNRNIIPTNDLSNISAESFHDDIEVLQSIIDNNVILYGQNPLKIGRQKWINMRLKSLDLSSLGITYLPEALCNIYPNLTKFDVDNNEICSPYPTCFDYIGGQNLGGWGV